MKYIVAITREETDDDATMTLQEEVTTTEVDLVLCETERDVYCAIRDADSNSDVNWALFEVVGKKTQRRAITWVMQGSTKIDLKIS